MNWMKDIKALIFDMDGTLYQDYSFMGRYISKMMANRFPEAEIDETVVWAYDLLEGRKPIKLGFMYDPAELLFYSHKELQPTAAYNWEGIETEALQDGSVPLVYLGDPWGIAQLIAIKKGISPAIREQAFTDVRLEMLEKAYCISKRTDLFDEISKLEGRRLILMTNSPLPTAQEFVDFMELNEVFDEFHFDGNKPHGIKALFEGLVEEGYEPHEILSVGDHPWNDLYPVHQAGGQTCLISEYKHDDATEWTVSVETIDELVQLVKRMNGQSAMANRKEETYG